MAGYARVSTDSDEQFTSYEAQVDYYTQFIKKNPDWEFVKVYTDEGISGTNIKRREGFNQMVSDALSGKIDLIVTKSVSRFARNTVDSLTTIRKLKEKGVEVFFEKENIWTFDSKGELLLTIMSSLAQEESRSISENITWGKRKQFADGKVSLPYKQFLGYRKGANGLPEIVPEEAEIVAHMIENTIATNAITALDQLEYAKTYESLTERYQALQKRYRALTRQRAEKEYKADILSGFLFEIGEYDVLDTEWSDSRFHAIVDHITVYNDGRLVFTFRNSSEETVMM